jgi:hypothetical protein
MFKTYRFFKSIFVLSILLFGILITVNPNISSAKLYNIRYAVDIKWSNEEIQKPIIPRDEIKEVLLNVTLRIDMGETFAQGVLDAYMYGQFEFFGVIILEIIDKPSWCTAVFNQSKVIVEMKQLASTDTSIFINIDEDAPAYGEGFIKIKAIVSKQGFIEGTENEYTLDFLPSFNPIIKLNLPETNTKRIDPMSIAEFPIEFENIGNARTRIFLTIENISEEWQATVTDNIILEDEKGSKATAVLTVIPPTSTGYHYEEANIKVKMVPARAENTNDTADPLYATFTVQNRGLSTYGSEAIIFYGIIVVIIILLVMMILRLLLKRRRKTSK